MCPTSACSAVSLLQVCLEMLHLELMLLLNRLNINDLHIWTIFRCALHSSLFLTPLAPPYFWQLYRNSCGSHKQKIPKSADFRIFLWFALSGGGSRGSRTPDPLLVRQTLWTNWAMLPFFVSFWRLLRWTAYRRSVIYMSKLPSSSLVRLVLTKNKFQKNLIYSWRFLRYASYHQSVIYESKLLSSSLAYLELS